MLLFAARSMLFLGHPWASTGQNQAYKKRIYNKVDGFKKISSYLQGDDTLFLQIARKEGANIVFNDSFESYVISRTEQTWKDFLLQRARWSGDANIMWKFNLPFYFAGLSLWIMSLGIIVLPYIDFYYFYIISIILLIKIILETALYYFGMKKSGESINYIDFIIWFLSHPIYVLLMGILSFFNFQWKGISIK